MAAAPWHISHLGVDQLHEQGLRGAGIRIAVVDTGIDPAMPTFVNARVSTVTSSGGSGGIDNTGHGTAMAAILVGDGIAVCPDATVLGVQAFLSNQWSVSYLVVGIRTAIAAGVDIISISGGVPSPDSELAAAVKSATDSGIVVVAAASNDAPNSAVYPADIPPAISVTGSDQSDALVHAVPPGWVNVAAPGIGIATVQWQQPCLQDGTSEATAITAGVCAVLLGAASPPRRRALGTQLRGFLEDTMIDASNASGPNQCGIVQPLAALTRIKAWL